MASKLKRNNENKGLPSRWRYKHGAYYFRVPEGLKSFWEGKTEYRLGKTLTESYRVWSEKLELHSKVKTMGELFDRYSNEVIPTKAAKSQESNLYSIKKLKPVFGHMQIESIKPMHVYQYKDVRGRQGKRAANMDIEVLSHCFTMAIEWGLTEQHPIKGKVKKFSIPPDDTYVEDWQLNEALKVATPFIKNYIQLKLLTGLRQTDLLLLEMSNIKNDGIYVKPHKTQNSSGKQIIIEWSPYLRKAVDEIINIRKVNSSRWLFHTNNGEPYLKHDGDTSAFKSAWRRFMENALKKTKLDKRFTERSLRAKVASDIEELTHASNLLAHTNTEITQRVYRRKPTRVKPAR